MPSTATTFPGIPIGIHWDGPNEGDLLDTVHGFWN